jgi:hypothetical protein
MKILCSLVVIMAFQSFVFAPPAITKQERKSAEKFLSESEATALTTVSKLSEAQLKFKPAPDKWSVEECMMHIAASESVLWGIVDGTMKAPANPEKRSEIKMSDDDVKKNIADRTNKVKTFPPLEPQNSGFKTAAEASASFKENRDKLIKYVNTTDDDLRNHVAKLEAGYFDSYQMVLFIGAHTNRHIAQMKEVMADPNFPKQ